MSTRREMFSNYLKLVVPAIIVLGVINLRFYYSAFNISIFDFLGFDEILNIYIGEAIVFTFLFAFGGIWSVLLIDNKHYEVKRKFDSEYLENNSPKRFIRFAFRSFFFPPTILFFILTLGAHFIKKFSSQFPIILTALFFFIAFLLLDLLILEFERHCRKKIDKEIPRYWFGFINLICYLFLFVLLFTVAEVHMVKKEKYYKNVRFTIKGSMFEGDENAYYIGKTRNYLFYYIEDSKTGVAVPMKDVDIIFFKKNKK